MYHITQKGSEFLSEGSEEAPSKQCIARKHLKLVVKGKKNDPKAKSLRNKYRELEGERVRKDELSIPRWAMDAAGDAVGDAGVTLGVKLALKGGKYLWNKAKGHNLPKVKVPKEMTADQKERAYKRFKRTASGKSLKEARGDQLKKHIVHAGRMSMPSMSISKTTSGPKARTAIRKRQSALQRYEGPMTMATRRDSSQGTGPERGSKVAKRAADELRSKKKFKKTLASIPTATDIDQTTRNRIKNQGGPDTPW